MLVTFIASAGSYFFAKTRLLSIFLILFYTASTFLSSSLFSNHPLFLCIIIIVFIALPILCLIIFALDVQYGLFCTDTSFVFILVWLLIPALSFINFITYLFKVLYA
ncbi:MAG: hypothetical protein AYP45_08665 [Candidatus Brocadia carolinensis]|uniref:Uncharacterized protein n=1 Tax=Candidatus Brocadia carolinensis TaxID=1004156 RepID=A0A1V4ATU8_9BACT|nr:MAG: hypothetical protein AYP45_08665 [Candidatus Brocadia caroliniensis]